MGVGSKLTLIEINLLFYLLFVFLHTLHADFVSWHMRYKQVLCVCDYVIWPDASAEIWPKSVPVILPGIVVVVLLLAAADKFFACFLPGWAHLPSP